MFVQRRYSFFILRYSAGSTQTFVLCFAIPAQMEFNVASCGSHWDYTLGNENVSAHPGTFRLVLDVVYPVHVDLIAKF